MGDKLVAAMRMAIHTGEMVRTQEAQSKALALANEELERLSYLDPLTGLANRRRLMMEMRTVGRAPMASLLIVDVDQFKQYNDTYGHAAGDTCLSEIGRVLANFCARNGGFAARYGGEEFCLLFGPAKAQGMAETAERLRAEIENLSTMSSVLARPVTISIGWALRKPDMFDDAFMLAADNAVYRAKRAGRNRVVNADSAMHEPLLAAI
jgi:diguanylate cyclase (GGDEF)-like protein